MYKKCKTLFIGVFLSFLLAACSSSNPQSSLDSSGEEESANNVLVDNNQESLLGTDASDEESVNNALSNDRKEPLLGADASDEELLELLKDDINVVTDDIYIETVTELIEHTNEFSGKLYQLEGTYTIYGGNPYITRTFADNGETIISALPLKYLTMEVEEGSSIKVTGIINEGEVNGNVTTVLEIVVLEIL